jgi:hypothetical protein
MSAETICPSSTTTVASMLPWRLEPVPTYVPSAYRAEVSGVSDSGVGVAVAAVAPEDVLPELEVVAGAVVLVETALVAGTEAARAGSSSPLESTYPTAYTDRMAAVLRATMLPFRRPGRRLRHQTWRGGLGG